MDDPEATSRLLRAAAEGDAQARREVEPRVYDELRRLARRHLERGGRMPSFEATDLVHEAWARLARRDEVGPEGRLPFLALAARAMRDIVVERARSRAALKRGGGARGETLGTELGTPDELAEAERALDVHEALEVLERDSPLHARLVELRYFAGLDAESAAQALGLSEHEQKKAWAFARRWLWVRLKGHGPDFADEDA